jgi:outer membrane lipoprotein carrier protein
MQLHPVRFHLVRHLSIFACAAIAVVAGLPGVAQAGAIEQLQLFTAGTHAATGDFTQTLVRKSTARAAPPSTGSFSFARPGKFRWNYAKPYEQTLLADGEKLWMYDKDLNQVTVRKLGTALGESPAAILFGSNDLAAKFILKEAGSRDGLDWLEALPKGKESTFQSVAIGFKDGLPQAMELRDAFGQTSLLNFSNLVRNPSFAAQQFRFDLPKGADVFEQ